MPVKTFAIAGAFVAATIGGAAAIGPARHPQAWNWCMNQQGGLLDQQIAGCTELIESSRKKINIGRIYYNRGLAYYRRGQYDLAVADYDQAIRFGYANALYNRSLAKEKLGDSAAAAADFAAFKGVK